MIQFAQSKAVLFQEDRDEVFADLEQTCQEMQRQRRNIQNYMEGEFGFNYVDHKTDYMIHFMLTGEYIE